MKHILTVSIVALLVVAGALALSVGPLNAEQAAFAAHDPVFYNELGYQLAQAGALGQAQTAFGQALVLNPSYELARYNYAIVAFQNGDYVNAASELRSLVAANPTAQYHFDYAQALVAQARFAETDGNLAVAELTEALTHLQAAGDFPHAAENARIVTQVLADVQ